MRNPVNNIKALTKQIKFLELNNPKIRPFCHYSVSDSGTTVAFLILLLPQLVMLYLTKSYSSLFIIFASILGVVLSEFIYVKLNRKKFYGLSSILQGILIGLLLPNTMSSFAVFFLSSLSTMIFKYSFGGYAHSWVNPVAITIALAWVLDVKDFPTFLLTDDNLFSHNPSLALIQNGSIPILSFDAKVTDYLNSHVFKFFGISVPEGYVSLFWDNGSVIPAFRFNFLTLISSAILFAFDFVSILIPALYILVYSACVYFVSKFVHPGISSSGDVILALMSSGTLFCSVFLLSWIGTTPLTNLGKVLYGIVAGVTAFFVVGCGTSPVGSVFTIILVNIFSLLVQQVENYFEHKRLETLINKKFPQEISENFNELNEIGETNV